MNRFYFHLLASALVVFLHDILNLGDGFYLLAGLFFWLAILQAKRIYRNED